MTSLRQCPHGFHHPYPDNLSYPHSCDGCWCEGLNDKRNYGWDHNTDPRVAFAETCCGKCPGSCYVDQVLGN